MTDILLDDNFDLQIINGDLVVGESTLQHQKLLLYSDKCEFKNTPMRGVGIRRYLETTSPDKLAREIKAEFYTDGMQVNTIDIAVDSIVIDAQYTN